MGDRGAYASEIKMLRSILSKMERLKRVPFIADKGYDAVDVIQEIKKLGGMPVVAIRHTQRKELKDDLRKGLLEWWGRWNKRSCDRRFVELLHVGGVSIFVRLFFLS